jgi:hypothetical protein
VPGADEAIEVSIELTPEQIVDEVMVKIGLAQQHELPLGRDGRFRSDRLNSKKPDAKQFASGFCVGRRSRLCDPLRELDGLADVRRGRHREQAVLRVLRDRERGDEFCSASRVMPLPRVSSFSCSYGFSMP